MAIFYRVTFIQFFAKDGILEEARAIAIKEAVAGQVQQAMLKENITKTEMARRMKTSRAALDRLLDPGMPPSRCRRCLGQQMRLAAVRALNWARVYSAALHWPPVQEPADERRRSPRLRRAAHLLHVC